jgi:uncharacterized membrane protein
MSDAPAPADPRIDEPHSSLVTMTHVTYLLHGMGLGLGAFAAATVVGVFGFGWSSILAVVLNYLKRSEARGTWLESHIERQIRTFWIGFAVAITIGLAGIGLVIGAITAAGAGVDPSGFSVGFLAWGMAWVLLGVWAIYRVISGWIALGNRRPVA